MAKKRVHEIAKERGISSKEVLAVLQKAGLDVKAAASSVDEDDIKRAFSNGAESPKDEQPKQTDAKASGEEVVQRREHAGVRREERPQVVRVLLEQVGRIVVGESLRQQRARVHARHGARIEDALVRVVRFVQIDQRLQRLGFAWRDPPGEELDRRLRRSATIAVVWHVAR